MADQTRIDVGFCILVDIMTEVPTHPFRRIALCCSGGGYRAAAFHLGVLSLLHKTLYQTNPLLENVKALSTVSGGTITGVIYAAHRQKHNSFEEIFAFIYDKLCHVDLLRLGLKKLDDSSVWKNSYKRKNLINAFAEIYDRDFTEGETFDIFENMHSHLDEVMFNSTDFSSGVIFRFQSDGRFGNHFHPVKRENAGEVKLSDIIAASSCFTGAFEPIEWPNDFLHDEAITLQDEAPVMPSVGLMDGGIYDNQGLDSILLAEERAGALPFDLIIVSDVTSPYLDPFRFFREGVPKGWRGLTFASVKRKIRSRVRLSIGAILGGFLSSLLLLFARNFNDSTVSGILIATCLALGLILVLWWRISNQFLRRRAGIKDYLDKMAREDLSLYDFELLYFENTPAYRLEALIIDRLQSLYTLIAQVFLKTVRRLVYRRLYESEKHQFRRASCLIKNLTKVGFNDQERRGFSDDFREQILPGYDVPSNDNSFRNTSLMSIVDSAARFGTKLWFSRDEKLAKMVDKLIITGQATMCYTLLQYIYELRTIDGNGYDKLPEDQRSAVEDLWDSTLDRWRRFLEDPFFMLNQLRHQEFK